MLLLKRLCRLRILAAVLLLAALTVAGLVREGIVLSSSQDKVKREGFTMATTTITDSVGRHNVLTNHHNTSTDVRVATQLQELSEAVSESAEAARDQSQVVYLRHKSSTRDDTLSTPPPSPPPPPPSSPARSSAQHGYVLALDYWEQQTSASRNLQALQCWAGQHNLSVVEPAMSKSQLRTPLNNQPVRKRFWFRDVFDVEMWNELSRERHHSQLVGWNDFLTSAPRDVILASIRYAFPDAIKQNLKQLSTSQQPTLSPYQRVQDGCSSNWQTVKEFLLRHHFTVVRQVCFNFAYGDRLSSQQFNSLLYGSLPPSSSTVVFSQWRGSGPPARVLIHDINCGNTKIQEEVGPSSELQASVATYQKRYLRGGPYLAIMARMEKVQAFLKSKNGPSSLAYCFSKLLSVWRETRQAIGLNATLLAIDMGKFGSNSIHNSGKGTELSARFDQFFSSLYDQQWSPEDWEESFEAVAHTADPGYVAVMQKVLVARAKCVVFIGGGSFQKHAQTLYVHSHQREPCIRVINECTQATNLHT